MNGSIKGRISGIKRNAVHDGEGLRTTVFCKGCPLRCVWCHNPESLSPHPEVGFYAEKCMNCGTCVKVCPSGSISPDNGQIVTNRESCTGCFTCTENCPADARIGYGASWDADGLARRLLADKLFFDNSGGGVTISGGECLSQPEFTAALAQILTEAGVSVNIDTCGAVSRTVLERVIPYTDVFLYDLKAIDPAVHKRCTGADNTRILENLRYLLEQNCRVEIRYPYVPGWNDGECSAIGAFLSGLGYEGKVKVLGYHGLADGKYTALGIPDTLPDVQVVPHDVDRAVEILRGFGLHAVNGMRED